MIKLIFDKYLELMNFEDQQGSRTDRYQILTERLQKFLEKNKNTLEELVEQNSLNGMSVKLIEWYNKDGDWSRRSFYIKLMLILAFVDDNQQKVQMEDRIKEFASNAPFETFSLIEKKYLSQIIKNFPNNFKDSVLKDLRIFNIGKGYVPKEELVNYVSAMLDKISGLTDIDQKEGYIDATIELKVASDKGLIGRLFDELNNLKLTNPDLVKKYSRKKFFDLAQRKTLKA